MKEMRMGENNEQMVDINKLLEYTRENCVGEKHEEKGRKADVSEDLIRERMRDRKTRAGSRDVQKKSEVEEKGREKLIGIGVGEEAREGLERSKRKDFIMKTPSSKGKGHKESEGEDAKKSEVKRDIQTRKSRERQITSGIKDSNVPFIIDSSQLVARNIRSSYNSNKMEPHHPVLKKVGNLVHVKDKNQFRELVKKEPVLPLAVKTKSNAAAISGNNIRIKNINKVKYTNENRVQSSDVSNKGNLVLDIYNDVKMLSDLPNDDSSIDSIQKEKDNSKESPKKTSQLAITQQNQPENAVKKDKKYQKISSKQSSSHESIKEDFISEDAILEVPNKNINQDHLIGEPVQNQEDSVLEEPLNSDLLKFNPSGQEKQLKTREKETIILECPSVLDSSNNNISRIIQQPLHVSSLPHYRDMEMRLFTRIKTMKKSLTSIDALTIDNMVGHLYGIIQRDNEPNEQDMALFNNKYKVQLSHISPKDLIMIYKILQSTVELNKCKEIVKGMLLKK